MAASKSSGATARVRLCTEDELKASFSRTNTAGIAFVRVELSSMEGSGPWLDDEPDSNVNVVFKEDLSALKSQSVANHADTHEEQLRLDAPMRTSDDVLRHLGHLDHFDVLVLASAATHRLIAPSSIINPYERRAHLTSLPIGHADGYSRGWRPFSAGSGGRTSLCALHSRSPAPLWRR